MVFYSLPYITRMSKYENLPNMNIYLRTVDVSKLPKESSLGIEKPLEEVLAAHCKRSLDLNRTLRKFHSEVKRYQKKHLDSRQRRHNLRHSLSYSDDSTPLLSLDFLNLRLQTSLLAAMQRPAPRNDSFANRKI